MGTIVEFEQFKKRKDEAYRNKMISEGRVAQYTCPVCGEVFDVYDDELPENCPHCDVEFTW